MPEEKKIELPEDLIEKIASVTHEANRAWCVASGDRSQQPWEFAPKWQRESAMNGVRFHAENPGSSPEASHENWMAEKVADGWVFGEVKDPIAKTHPCIVPYDDLPFEHRIKDSIFGGIVASFLSNI